MGKKRKREKGKTSFIISGDKHLLAVKKYQGIQIIKARDFFDLIASSPLGGEEKGEGEFQGKNLFP